MLKHQFLIDKYDWEVYAFYKVRQEDFEDVYSLFNRFGYSDALNDVLIGIVNSGYCYTDFKAKRTIIIVSDTTNMWQFCNTIVHELNHVGSHIEEYYNIDPHSEEASYLMGELAQRVSYFLNYILL